MQEPIAKTYSGKSLTDKNKKNCDKKNEKRGKKKKEVEITNKEIEELKKEKAALEEKNKQLTGKLKLINMSGEDFRNIMECYVEFFRMIALERQSLMLQNNNLKEKIGNLDTAVNLELRKFIEAKKYIEELIERENMLRNEIEYQDEMLEKIQQKCADLKYFGVVQASAINFKINKGKEQDQEATKLRTKISHNHAKLNVLAKQISDKGYIFAPLRNSIAKNS